MRATVPAIVAAVTVALAAMIAVLFSKQHLSNLFLGGSKWLGIDSPSLMFIVIPSPLFLIATSLVGESGRLSSCMLIMTSSCSLVRDTEWEAAAVCTLGLKLLDARPDRLCGCD